MKDSNANRHFHIYDKFLCYSRGVYSRQLDKLAYIQPSLKTINFLEFLTLVNKKTNINFNPNASPRNMNAPQAAEYLFIRSEILM